MEKILILGSNSFIGQHLTKHLSNFNVRVSVFGRTIPNMLLPNQSFFEGDFSDRESLRKSLASQDIIYHFISQTNPATSWDCPKIEVEKNLLPTLELIELACQEGVKKICFISSGGTVYGFQSNFLNEESPTAPFSPYGIIKRSIESFLQYAKLKHQLYYDIFRVSNVYGEGQDIGKGLGFINTTLENIIQNRPISIYGDGENVRDYIYVQDVARLLMISLQKDLTDSGVYNISSNNPISLNNLLMLIKDVVGFDFQVNYLPKRLSDNYKVILDNSKIMQYFSAMQLVSLQEGIKITFEKLRKDLSLRKSSYK
jgi:UDP-glucose 4-epimerase